MMQSAPCPRFGSRPLGGCWHDHAAMHAGRARAQLAAAGAPIGPYDVLIAGHARSLGLVVVTNNEREFARVPGLEVENWLL